MRRGATPALAAVAAILALTLSGCFASSSKTPTTPTGKATAQPGTLGALQPVIPKKLTAASAKTATDNLAEQIDALIASTDIVYIDNHEKLIPATSSTGATYAVIRTINVTPKLDPIEQASAMEKLLVAAGWKLEDDTSATSKYLAALSSSTDSSTAWFLLLGADATSPKQPVLTVQLASPNIPATK